MSKNKCKEEKIVDIKAEVNVESEIKSDIKTETKAESEVKTDIKAEEKIESEVKTYTKKEAKATFKTNIKDDTKSGNNIENHDEFEKIELSIDLKTRDMYEFQMRHSYLNITGIISVLASLCALVYLIVTFKTNDYMMNMLLVLASLLFTVIYPMQTLSRAFKLVKLSPVLSRTLNYTFTTEGILVSQDDDDALLPWEDIVRVIETKKLILVYSSPKNGYILPKVQYKDKYDDIKMMFRKQLEDTQCSLELKGN